MKIAILITATALATSATVASADSYISNFGMQQDRNGPVGLGTVRAAGTGVVEVFAVHRGEIGALLGAEPAKPGANVDVDLDILHPATNAIAVLNVNGQIVDTQEIDFD